MVQFITGLDKISRIAEKYLDGSVEESDFQTISDNLFAAKQFDAFGKIPSGLTQRTYSGVGNYAACEDVDGLKYETNYCHVVVFFRKGINCDYALSPVNYLLPRMKLSVCMPRSCSSFEITETYQSTLSNLPLTVCDTHCVKKSPHEDVETDDVFFWMVTSFFTIIFSMAVCATFLESRNEQIQNTAGIGTKILLCFSLISNFRRILSVKEYTENEIKGIDFLRTASAFWVVTVHCSLSLLDSDSLKTFLSFRTKFFDRLIFHGEFAVDAFFFIFGVTLAFVFRKQRLSDKEIRSPGTWIAYVCTRYFRLIPPMITWVLVFTIYGEYLIGPTDSFGGGGMEENILICKNHWWKLLYFRQADGFLPEICYPWTWYIAEDFRIYLMSAVLLAVMHSSIRKALLLMAVVGAVSVLWTFYLYSSFEFSNFFLYTLFIHVSGCVRLPIVLIGMITGYILFNKHSWEIHFKRKRVLLTGWLACGPMLTYAFLGNWDHDQGARWTYIQGATYFVLSRICWSLFLSWIVLTCNFHLSNPLASFMSHPIWRPFGKLTYCIYLVHPTTMFVIFNLSDRPQYATSMIHLIVSMAIPIFVVSTLIAFIWSACFEVATSVFSLFTSNPLPNLSPQCKKEIVQFITGLDKISRIAEKYLDGSVEESDFQTISDNLFAAKQFDAFGKIPSGITQQTYSGVGNYAACEDVNGLKYETNYCHVVVFFERNISCDYALSPISMLLPRARLAVCMPRSCLSSEITMIYESALADLPVTVCKSECVRKDLQEEDVETDDVFFWMVTSFFTIIFSMTVCATFLDSRNEQIQNTAGIGTKILLCFSLISNFRRILSVKEYTENEIKGIDFLRTAAAFWVITGHCIQMLLDSDSLKTLFAIRENFFERIVFHGEFAVETFFFIFGFTLVSSFLKQRLSDKEIRSPGTWIAYVCVRYFRLIPAMITWVLVFTVYGEYLIGPFDSFAMGALKGNIQICKDHWWKLLYFKQGDGFLPEMCYPSTWYLAADFRIYLMSAVLLAVMNTSIRKALLLMAVAGSLSIIWTFYLHSSFDFSNFFLYTIVIHMSGSVRLPTVFIGMLTGLVLLNRKLFEPFSGRKWLVSVCWMGSLVMVTYVFLGNWDHDQGARWTYIQGATYFVLSRICWSLFLSWIVLTCNFHLSSPLAQLMSHPIWRPFGRLTYCIYLVHMTVIHGVLNLSDRPVYATSLFHLIVTMAIPVIVICLFVALFWSAIVEVGASRLVHLLMTESRRRSLKED